MAGGCHRPIEPRARWLSEPAAPSAASGAVRGIDALEAPQQPGPRQPAAAALPALRRGDSLVAGLDDVLADWDQLAAAGLGAHLDRAARFQVIYRHEGVGDGLADGEETVIAEDQRRVLAEVVHEARLLVVVEGRAL